MTMEFSPPLRELLRHDTLIADPPRSLRSGLRLLGWIDEKIDVFGRLVRIGG